MTFEFQISGVGEPLAMWTRGWASRNVPVDLYNFKFASSLRLGSGYGPDNMNNILCNVQTNEKNVKSKST